MRCPPVRFRRPGSGCPAVRPSGVRSPGVVVQRVRRSAVCCPAVRCPAVRCPPVRCPAVCCLPPSAPVGPDASVSFHLRRWRWGPRSRRPGRGRRCRSRVGPWEVGGGRAAGLGAGRGGRACPLSDQAGQAGLRSAPRGRLRGGRGCKRQREVAAPAAWLPSSGWVRDHGAWSSPSLTPGWADPEGPLEVPAGMGVRPQRGPSRQRTLLARCRQRCDLRRWVVGLGGVEPPTSSLSEMDG
jgi:hypothetical protein